MRILSHPALDQIELHTVMHALGSPIRLALVMGLLDGKVHQGSEFDLGVGQSTLSHHVKVLREAGLVQSDPEGTRCLLSLRLDEVNTRFPGLIDNIAQLGANAPR